MEKSNNIFKFYFAVLIFYILWGISVNFGGLERLLEFLIWFFSFIFIYVPSFLIYVLVYKFKKPKDTNPKSDEKYEDYEEYVERRIDKIQRDLRQYKK